MRIVLNEKDISTAIEGYILENVTVPDDMRIDIDLKATRGEQGYTAEIDLVHMTSPADGSDRSVDPRIEATDEARAEGLGIVEKIDAARSEAKAPRRRGRPVGSVNKPKTDVVQGSVIAENQPNQETQAAMQDVRDGNTEKTGTVEQTMTELNAPENYSEAIGEPEATAEAVKDPEPEQVQPQPESEGVVAEAPAEVVAEANIETPPAEVPVEAKAADVQAADTSTQVQKKRSLFDNISDAGDDKAADPEPEPNSEAALAAEAAATEPAEEEDEVLEPTPETKGFETEEAQAPTPAPTRSLFADLTKPAK